MVDYTSVSSVDLQLQRPACSVSSVDLQLQLMSTCTSKSCSRPSAPGHKTCQYHLDYHRQLRKQKQEKVAAIQAETGVQLCIHCSRGIKPGSRAVAAAFGKKGCEPCLAACRLRTAARVEEVGEAYASWVVHKSTVTQRYGAGMWLTLSLFTDLMYPFGPNGPRATCDELKPDGSRCGGEGTVNRIFSRIKSYRPEDLQVCNVLCAKHNTKYGRTDPRFPGTVSKQWQKSVAAWMSRPDVQKAVAA